MINIDKWLKVNKVDVFMIMQVHDELVFEMRNSDIENYGKKICSLMSDAHKLKVPLIVNTFSGKNWRDT